MLFSDPEISNPFVKPNFDDTISSESSISYDPDVFYCDIQESMNGDSKYAMKKRNQVISNSYIKSKNALAISYGKKLDKLAAKHQEEIDELKREWTEARSKADLDDISSYIQDQKTRQILSLNGKKASHASHCNGKNSVNCDKKYMSILSIIENRHKCEIDALVSAYQSELNQSATEHKILSKQVKDQYNTELIINTAEMIKMITESKEPVIVKERLIHTVSPQKRKPVDRSKRIMTHAVTPIPKYRGFK